jgi:adenylate kinase family enzyme
MEKKALNRILIVGDAARGKSTLAENLSKKLGIPHYSTDDFFYEIKFSKVRDRAEAVEQIKEIFKKEKWIIEGTTKRLVEHGLHSADMIIHLQHKNIPTQWFILFRRYLKRDNETIFGLFKLMKHVLFKKYKWGDRKGKPTPSEIIDPHKHKVITLSSFKEIDEFLKNL